MPRPYSHEDDEQSDEVTSFEDRPPPRNLKYLYKDEHLVVVNKPSGLEVQDPDDGSPNVLAMAAHDELYSDRFIPEAVYMLDVAVSGALVLPRTTTADASLTEQCRDGRLSVLLHVLVRGPVMHNEGEISLHVGFAGHGASARMRVVPKGGYDSRTQWKVEDRFIGYALLTCRTTPVLPHQVRLHLSHAGLPLAVDPLYGGGRELRLSSFKAGYRPSKRHGERPLIERVSMHVARVSLRHPVTSEAMSIDAPPPKDFRAAVHQLGRFARIPR